MKKTITTVFLVIAVLVMIFLIWELFFTDAGILHSAYNAVAKGINGQWNKISGTSVNIVPYWGSDDGGQVGNAGAAKDDSEGLNIDVQ